MTVRSHHANPDDIDISEILNAVARNFMRLILISAVIGAVVFVVLSFMKPQYSSQAKILIENEQGRLKDTKGNQNQANTAKVDKEAVTSQAQILLSNDLAHRVAKKLKLNLNPEFNSALGGNSWTSMIGLGGNDSLPESERIMRAYYKRLKVFPLKDSHVITVEFRAQTPQLAANIANELAHTYIGSLQLAGVSQSKDARKWLGEEIGQLRRDVELAEQKVAKLRASTGTMLGRDSVTLNVQQLGEINSRLSLAKAQKSEAVARAQLIGSMLRAGSIDSSPDVLKSRLIQRLNEQRVRVQRQVAELSANLKPRHPRMVQLRAELAGLSRQIKSQAVKLVRGLQNEAKIAAAKEASLLQSINELQQRNIGQSDSQAQLRVLEREAKSKRELYESYVSRLGEASARQNGISVPVMARIVQKATASNIPVFPKKLPITIIAVVATILLGLAWIVTRELLHGARRASPSSANSAPVVPSSEIPHLKPVGGLAAAARVASSSRATPAIAENNIPSNIAEQPSEQGSLVALAQHLGGSADNQSEHGYRTLIACEEGGVDGAAQAIGIAQELDRSGKSVVLIDWETGENSVVAKLGRNTAPGILDLIDGRVGFTDILRPVPGCNVHIISAGLAELEMSAEEEKAQIELILDALDETYDHIVAYGSYGKAQELFRITEGRFDAGVTICDNTSLPNKKADMNCFLGYTVEGIDVQNYVPDSCVNDTPNKTSNETSVGPAE